VFCSGPFLVVVVVEKCLAEDVLHTIALLFHLGFSKTLGARAPWVLENSVGRRSVFSL
jgi:hypothetical protein